MTKAILLLSGGLDSTLAGKILLDLGVEVEALHFTTPFCNCTPKKMGCNAARAAADEIGIHVRTVASGLDYLETMKHPRHGRGAHMNACIDCRIHTFTLARELMAEVGADFVATGEVLGQRPMSQRLDAMNLIERESGLSGLIVRPLCAQHMPPSQPETDGLIARDRLLAMSGRGRRPQMELADALGIKGWLCPAGGCMLTMADFAERFAELLKLEPSFDLTDARLLRYGRHFRLPGGAKAIVGRDATENTVLEQMARRGDAVLQPANEVPGPTVLVRRLAEPIAADDVKLAAGLVAAYVRPARPVAVEVNRRATKEEAANEPGTMIDAAPLDPAVYDKWRVGAFD